MMIETGITGVRTSEKIEFNPQRDLLGRVEGHPGWRPRYPAQGARRVLRAV